MDNVLAFHGMAKSADIFLVVGNALRRKVVRRDVCAKQPKVTHEPEKRDNIEDNCDVNERLHVD